MKFFRFFDLKSLSVNVLMIGVVGVDVYGFVLFNSFRFYDVGIGLVMVNWEGGVEV